MGEEGGIWEKNPIFENPDWRSLSSDASKYNLGLEIAIFLQKALFPIFYDRFQIFFQKVKVAKHWICLLGLIFSLKIKNYAKFFFENLL